MTPSKASLLLTMAGVLLPGVAGAQTTTVPAKQCPPPTILSPWVDNDDVYTVKLTNRLTVLGLGCQHAQAGLVMVALPERTVLAATVVSLYYILPGGVGQGPPAEVALPRPVFPCGTHRVEIDVVPADVAAGVSPGQQAADSVWWRKVETVDNGTCPTIPPAQPAAAAPSTTPTLPPPTTVASAQSSPAEPARAAAQQIVAPTTATTTAAPLPAPPAPTETAAASVDTTTTSQPVRMFEVAAAAPTTTPTPPVGALPPPDANHAGLLAGLAAIVTGLVAVLIGWRRQTGGT